MAAPVAIGPDVARTKGMFGPVYHGTSEESRQAIASGGFEIFGGLPRTGNTVHGYQASPYGSTGIWPPIHHLGYGVYFTTSLAIAKRFNQGTGKGLVAYMLDVPRIEKINWGSPNTMMKWWRENGYDMKSSSELAGMSEPQKMDLWVAATTNLTNTLKSKYDAVWYKGKGLRQLLDGDQVCVFDASRIYRLDNSLAKFDTGSGVHLTIGDRIIIRDTKSIAKVKSMRAVDYRPEYLSPLEKLAGRSNYQLQLSDWQNFDEFVSVWKPRAMEELEKMHADPENNKLAAMRAEGRSKEEMTRQWIDYMFNKESISIRFPSALVEKVIPKGQRFAGF